MAYAVISRAKKYERRLGSLARGPVRNFQVGVTNSCYFRCKWCANGYNLGKNDYMPLGMFEFAADTFPAKSLTLSLGEPTKHPEISGILGASISRGIEATVVTNGYNLRTLSRLFEQHGPGVKYALSVSDMHHEQYQKKKVDFLQRIKTLKKLAKHNGTDITLVAILDWESPASAFLYQVGEEFGLNGEEIPWFVFSSWIRPMGFGKDNPEAKDWCHRGKGKEMFVDPTGKIYTDATAWFEDIDDKVIAMIQEV